jgi:hypothetical protein
VPVGVSNNKIAFIGGMLNWYNNSKTIEIYDPVTNTFSYKNLKSDLLFENIVSFNNYIYSIGGTIESGDKSVTSICRLLLE